ncbi:MAG: polysaccharide biosynthesis protein, partial [Eubacterium sp.]|nr:polysaccharide biosynthesis protein [Eubacterium sp.]
IGNSIIVDTKEKVYTDFRTFLLIIIWIAGFCCSCFLCLYQPFMELWVGKDLMLEFSIVICLVIYFFIYQINKLLNTYKDASGMWHEDRFRPLVTALVNLTLNLILVQFIGLYGIVLSTIISMLCVGMPWLLHNLFTVTFERKQLKKFLLKLLYYVIVTLLTCVVVYYICTLADLPLVITIIFRLAVCAFLSNLLFLLFYHRLPEFMRGMELVDRMTKNKIKPLHLYVTNNVKKRG